MDGSSKFVKGDAIAGIIITIVNLVGGILIGLFQHDMTMAESGEVYTILTIGDGLVAQLPALILSTATAIIITRSNMDEEKFASQSISQLTKDSKSLILLELHYCYLDLFQVSLWVFYIYNGNINDIYRLCYNSYK